MFSSEFIRDGHTKRLTITRSGLGWEIREEHDSRLVRECQCRDWHRVERARQLFAVINRLDPEPLLAS